MNYVSIQYLRRTSCRTVSFSVEKDSIDDVNDAVGKEDIGLHNAGSHVPRSNILASCVDRETKVLSSC